MENSVISLTQKLIAIRSTPDNKEALEQCLNEVLKQLKGYTVEWFESNGYKSVLVYNTPKRPKKFKIILNGHLDIIPGKESQYTPQIKNGRLYGVGAMDMKASVASFVEVFKEVANKINYPLGIQLVTDEEIGGFYGTKYQIDNGVRAEFVIVGETTNFKIENEAKGIIWMKIAAYGKAAHAAYPWMGKNAIWRMNDFLNLLSKKFPLLEKKEWLTTINLAKITTNNNTFNKIPDQCEIWLDIRYIPEDTKTIIKNIKDILPKGFSLEIIVKEPAQFVNKDNSFIKLLQKIGRKHLLKSISVNQGQGSSDARHFTRVKTDAIEFGPYGQGMGTDNEWIDIQSLNNYSQILKEFLLNN